MSIDIFKELSKKNSSYKSSHSFFVANCDVKQVCVQLQKLNTNKRLLHWNNLLTSIC